MRGKEKWKMSLHLPSSNRSFIMSIKIKLLKSIFKLARRSMSLISFKSLIFLFRSLLDNLTNQTTKGWRISNRQGQVNTSLLLKNKLPMTLMTRHKISKCLTLAPFQVLPYSCIHRNTKNQLKVKNHSNNRTLINLFLQLPIPKANIPGLTPTTTNTWKNLIRPWIP